MSVSRSDTKYLYRDTTSAREFIKPLRMMMPVTPPFRPLSAGIDSGMRSTTHGTR